MKRILLLATLLLSFPAAYAQMGEAEQKAMEAYGTPGPMHAMLANDNGSWSEEVKIWMEPGAEPMTFKAEVRCEMIMDGRYQQQSHRGEMMGMPFMGLSTTGYDNARGLFVNTWVDNFGTGVMYSEGKWDAKTKSIEFKGMATEPMAKNKQIPVRQVLYFIDDNHQRMEMYMTHDGKEFKSMETTLTRG